ncbi:MULTISPECIES: Fe2+-enterobactin ABC transporter substrate-binding protein [unclassified Bosea (in: a-proteobacteria)]|uniref:Fe2+-enterobactin ABC transporter substrate-binding protein n=1 Tax=unclassified Bosea (in: a-proteobacteria) TaxID=2653178 RepID=UPI00125EFDBF|nr:MULTISPECIES: Fe2+-enterobactin ABC transporter substrate-binding protein [unclassified Bosea (in: a-proteobacteria)]
MPLIKLFIAIITIAATLSGIGQPAWSQEAGWPRTIRHAAGELTLARKPLRIVSTTPSVTGILLAIEAPLLASTATTPSPLTDAKGFFSQWAADADKRGVKVLYPNLKFDIEAVLGWKPDLVIASTTGADSILQHRAELEALGVPTLVVDYSSRSWQELATELGQATGLEKEAAAAIARFDADLAAAAPAIAAKGRKASIVGYNIAGSYSVARTASPVSKLVSALGFEVVGLPAELKQSSARPSDFEFFSRENLSAAIAADTVLLLRATDNDVEAFLAEPVLANHPAVTGKRVYPLGLTSFRIDPYSGRQIIERLRESFARR